MSRSATALLTAQVYPPGENELYRGTRFDHAGVVFHVTYKGQDYSSYWFDRFVTDPARQRQISPGHANTACCAASGPVEEFAAVGFDEAGWAAASSSPASGSSRRDNDDPLTVSHPAGAERRQAQLQGHQEQRALYPGSGRRIRLWLKYAKTVSWCPASRR